MSEQMSKKHPWAKKYRLAKEVLGAGGQGQTKLCWRLDDTEKKNPYVIKTLQKPKDPERRMRLRREVNALKLISHPHVVKLVDSNVLENDLDLDTTLYLVTEFIEGQTLSNLVRSNGPFGLEQSILICKTIVVTLEHCHDQGLFHRDIKPDNVIIDESGSPVLIDFGLAYHGDFESSLNTMVSQQLGNRFLRLPELDANYGPPEFKRQHVSDLTYAIGLLFYMLTGSSPTHLTDAYHGSMPHQREKAKNEILKAVSRDKWAEVEHIFSIGFQPTVDRRFQSAAELLQKLELVESGNPTSISEKTALELINEHRYHPANQNRISVYWDLFGLIDNVKNVYASMLSRRYRNNLKNHVEGESINVGAEEAVYTIGYQLRYTPAIHGEVQCIFRRNGSEYLFLAKAVGEDERVLATITSEDMKTQEKMNVIQIALEPYLDEQIKKSLLTA